MSTCDKRTYLPMYECTCVRTYSYFICAYVLVYGYMYAYTIHESIGTLPQTFRQNKTHGLCYPIGHSARECVIAYSINPPAYRSPWIDVAS